MGSKESSPNVATERVRRLGAQTKFSFPLAGRPNRDVGGGFDAVFGTGPGLKLQICVRYMSLPHSEPNKCAWGGSVPLSRKHSRLYPDPRL